MSMLDRDTGSKSGLDRLMDGVMAGIVKATRSAALTQYRLMSTSTLRVERDMLDAQVDAIREIQAFIRDRWLGISDLPILATVLTNLDFNIREMTARRAAAVEVLVERDPDSEVREKSPEIPVKGVPADFDPGGEMTLIGPNSYTHMTFMSDSGDYPGDGISDGGRDAADYFRMKWTDQ